MKFTVSTLFESTESTLIYNDCKLGKTVQENFISLL